MDPNAALADLRDLATAVHEAQPHIDAARTAAERAAEGDSNDAEIDSLNDLVATLDAAYRCGHTLADKVVALDESLANNGHLPAAWQPLPGPRPADHATLGQLTMTELVSSALDETLGLGERLRELGVDDQVANAFVGSIGSRLAVAKGKL